MTLTLHIEDSEGNPCLAVTVSALGEEFAGLEAEVAEAAMEAVDP